MASIRLGYILVIIILVSGCARRPVKTQNDIVYCVFDSLEQYFIEEIAQHVPTDTVLGIAIQECSRCNGLLDYERKRMNPMDSSVDWYEIAVVYRSMFYRTYEYQGVFEASNRKMQLGNELYPIYFPRTDYHFLYKARPRRLMPEYDTYEFGASTSEPKKVVGYFPPRLGEPFSFSAFHYVYVDMARQIFYTDLYTLRGFRKDSA